MSIVASQVRAGRALLGWSQLDLCEAATVSDKTLRDFEAEARQPRLATIEALRKALERAGVEFIEENGGGPGVRLRKRRR